LTNTFEVRRVEPEVLYDLRRRVLRADNPDVSVAYARDTEETSIHYAGLLGERVVVSASLYPSESPINPELKTYQLRYVATDFDVQGKGLGGIVLDVAEDELRSLGVEQVWANGRDTALDFYRAHDWQLITGSEHLSPETKLPHTIIYKLLLSY
jgi:GNAT superfamily N-acetyltransferase